MALFINNYMTGRSEPFEPRSGGKVGVYVCGPTLGDCCHLGHLRTYLSFDVIVRYLEYKGYEVEYISNLTDIDENSIITPAKQTNEDPLALSRRFERAFFEDIQAFHLRSANRYPRASDHIPEIIETIETLVQKGVTYESDGVIYFGAMKFPDFGKLCHRRRSVRLLRHILSVPLFGLFLTLHSIFSASVEAILSFCLSVPKSKVRSAARRRGPYDFVLWKRVNEDELGWESPWGRGRPGWHIECSVMSRKYLGPQFDVHGGGEDLRRCLHHDSEIALSELATGKKPFVKYWAHTGVMTLKGRKMAKSTGNRITARDFLKIHSAESLRLLVLSKPRRQRIDFTEEELTRHEEMIRRIYEVHDALNELIMNLGDGEPEFEEERRLLDEILGAKREFLRAMDDDFNSAIALAKFCKLIGLGDEILNMRAPSKLVKTALDTINELGDILGLIQEQKNLPVLTEAYLPF